MDSLEDKEYLGAHSTTNGESTAQDGIQFVDRIFASSNLNLSAATSQTGRDTKTRWLNQKTGSAYSC